MKARVLSGIQPTGSPHIGNYLGALKNWARIQYDYDSIYCIVDLHAVTVYQEPRELRTKIEELAGMLLAIGIDPAHSALVVQSSVAAHAEREAQVHSGCAWSARAQLRHRLSWPAQLFEGPARKRKAAVQPSRQQGDALASPQHHRPAQSALDGVVHECGRRR